MKNKYKTLTTNMIIFSLAMFTTRIINFLLIPLYTNILSTSQFGQVEIVLNCANLLIPFLSLSINDAFLRFGLDDKVNSKNILKTTSKLLIGSSVVTIFLSPFFYRYSSIGEFTWLFIVICISQMFNSTYSLYAKILGKNNIFAYNTIIYTLSLGLFNIIFILWLKLAVVGYLFANVATNITCILFLCVKLKIFKDLKEGKFHKDLLIEMLKYSSPMIANAVSWWILQFSDKLMLDYYLSNADVGIYSIATKMPSVLTMFVGVFSQAWLISAVTEYNKEGSSEFYSKIFSIFLFILTVSTCGLLCVIKWIMKEIIGIEFLSSIIYTPLLIEGAFFGSISLFVDPIYSAVKKNIVITTTTFIAAVCNIILNIIFIPKFHIMGAVISTLISYIIFGMIKLYNSRCYVNYFISNIKVVSASLITITLAIYITNSDTQELKFYILLFLFVEMIIFCIFFQESRMFYLKIKDILNEKK